MIIAIECIFSDHCETWVLKELLEPVLRGVWELILGLRTRGFTVGSKFFHEGALCHMGGVLRV